MWVTKVLRSFRYALDGLKYTFVTQRNMRIHFLISVCVLLLCLYLPFTKAEVLVLFTCITLVLFAELINTVIEKIVDLVTEEYHPLAKIAKDVAAGAVLLTAGLAVIVGLSLFYPYLNQLFLQLVELDEPTYGPSIGFAAIIVVDFFITLMVKGWLTRSNKSHLEPSMTTSIAVCVATLIVSMIGNLFIALLVYALTLMLVVSRYRMKPRLAPITLGIVLGITIALVGIILF